MTSQLLWSVTFFAQQINDHIPFTSSICLFFLDRSLSSTMNPHHLLAAMDDKKLTTETHHITAHGTTMLEVVYTNEPETME
jgi:hypothetical protein